MGTVIALRDSIFGSQGYRELSNASTPSEQLLEAMAEYLLSQRKVTCNEQDCAVPAACDNRVLAIIVHKHQQPIVACCNNDRLWQLTGQSRGMHTAITNDTHPQAHIHSTTRPCKLQHPEWSHLENLRSYTPSAQSLSKIGITKESMRNGDFEVSRKALGPQQPQKTDVM